MSAPAATGAAVLAFVQAVLPAHAHDAALTVAPLAELVGTLSSAPPPRGLASLRRATLAHVATALKKDGASYVATHTALSHAGDENAPPSELVRLGELVVAACALHKAHNRTYLSAIMGLDESVKVR